MAKPRLFTLAICLSLAACSWLPERMPGIHRVDIQQGNAISQEMIDQLQPGLNKRQVSYIMGTPLIQDAFHKDRWDYVYTSEPKGEPRTQKRLTLLFDQDQLMGVEGDYRPSDEVKLPTAHDTVVPIPPRELDDSWWGTIKRWLNKK